MRIILLALLLSGCAYNSTGPHDMDAWEKTYVKPLYRLKVRT